ncbi:anthranilate synthase component I [Tumebacillus permanentifrigoris]|uniref:Anthranilate synthase n=1 Tax=Tumebacillus permanentifrigoris TaxID=378543 RepID=A0A316D940_9BACL|nr:anthranilate synthase component I [Tumebacillus permanentifrigoris]PWK13502.1 anthranilate synthase component I [Tumebacillus permanentifrigoris]
MSILSNLKFASEEKTYTTREGIAIYRSLEQVEIAGAVERILHGIDERRGALFSSSYEYPGRYSRWDIGFLNPALEVRASASGRSFTLTALNSRGEVLMDLVGNFLTAHPAISLTERTSTILQGTIQALEAFFYEEERSRQTSVFTVIRAVKDLFANPEDGFLGLYGAFGYDLIYQLEPIELQKARDADQSDLVMFLPDELMIVDHQMNLAYRLTYEFEVGDRSTRGLPREGTDTERSFPNVPLPEYVPGRYAQTVRGAMDYFRRGDMFEVVPTQSIFERCADRPSDVFSKLKQINPSPYGFIINLGDEYLVGSSPEMYVRVEGDRVETCPISGTIKRGQDALEDADRIRELLNSIKDESELTMCTDVDRNDKSRICVPGSVKVIGRRQTEMYSHLIHTVDHVEGRLAPQYDSLDAFITHMWAVTITGAPKPAAIRWIEQNEPAPRIWYGGAVGYLAFNGDLNTGLTLRTIRIKNDVAEIRVGATVLYDSIPEDEEAETLTKAAALVQAIRSVREGKLPQKLTGFPPTRPGAGKRVLFVDHEDSFVHTLANYFRQTGADVVTLRSHFARQALAEGREHFDLVLLSPGPGRPEQFQLSETISLCVARELPVFGVCLGLQGIVEHFGGALDLLPVPRHGKPAKVLQVGQSEMWAGLPAEFTVGLYHSLHAAQLPEVLRVTAQTEDGIVMGVEHTELPITAVQFHPESIMTARNQLGLKMIENVLGRLSQPVHSK